MKFDGQHHEHEDGQDNRQCRGIKQLLAGNHAQRIAYLILNVNDNCARDTPVAIAFLILDGNRSIKDQIAKARLRFVAKRLLFAALINGASSQSACVRIEKVT